MCKDSGLVQTMSEDNLFQDEVEDELVYVLKTKPKYPPDLARACCPPDT